MKASKLLWVLLALMLSMALVVGCGGEDPEDPNGPLGDGDWTIVWFAYSPGAGADLLTFHVGGGDDDGVASTLIIEKIYMNATASVTGAYVLFDFTKDPAFKEADMYEWAPHQPFKDGIKEIGTANGRYELTTESGHVWGGGFGGPVFNDHANIGFLIKTKDVAIGSARFLWKDSEPQYFKDLLAK